MWFDSSIEGLAATIHVPEDGGSCRVSIGELGSFDSINAARRAVQSYNLKLRKDFDNPEAYLRAFGGEAVTVTSICEDDKHCWIKRKDGRRSKVRLETLYEGSVAVLAALEEDAKEDEAREKRWGAIRWHPRTEASDAG